MENMDIRDKNNPQAILFGYTSKGRRVIDVYNNVVRECSCLKLDGVKLNDLLYELNDLWEQINKHFPEVNKLGSYFEVRDDSGCSDIADSWLDVHWTRNIYDFDKLDVELKKNTLERAAIHRLEELIEQYPEKAKEIMSRLDKNE